MLDKLAIRATRKLRQLLCSTVVVLAACGGGGGSGADAPLPVAAPSRTVFSGTVSDMGSRHVAVPVAAGREIGLYSTDLSGTPGSLLAKTTTAEDGSYLLTAPDNTTPGVGLLIQTTDATGLPLRSLALGSKVHVGPSSEVVTRALVAAQASYGQAFKDSVERLAKFQRAAEQFLDLMGLNASDNVSALGELSEWLVADPASHEVLSQVALSGTLPASIGDVGGMYRLGTAAWEAKVDDSASETTSTVFSPANGGEFTFYRRTPDDYLTGLASSMTAVVRMTGDGAQYIVSPGMLSANGNVQVWAKRIGQYPMAHFGTVWGVVDTLSSVAGQTVGYTYDNDQIEDSFTYKLDRTIVGVEAIEAGGRTTRALRIDTTETLVIILSKGGEIRSVARTSSWHVPFVGSVLSQTTLDLTDANGVKTTGTSTETLVRSVVNDMSWPARVHVQTVVNKLPGASADFKPVALLDPSTALYMSNDRFMVVDPQKGAVLAEALIPSLPNMAKRLVRIAPDRSVVYVVVSPSHLDQSTTTAFAQDLSGAANGGAWVYRLDARSLVQQLQIQVPPRLSDKAAGQGFAQSYVGSAVVSPLDARQLVLSSIDVVHLNNDHFSPDTIHQAEELGEPAYGPVLISIGSHNVLGWNPSDNAVYLSYYTPISFLAGLWPSGIARVPVSVNGLSMAQAQTKVIASWPAGLPGWYTNLGDLFIGNKLWFDDLQASVDFDSALGVASPQAPTDRLADPVWGAFYSSCAHQPGKFICLSSGNGLRFTDERSVVTEDRSVDTDLRIYAGASLPNSESSVFAVAGTNRYVSLANVAARMGGLGVRSTLASKYTVLP